jgi:hypothetical protein
LVKIHTGADRQKMQHALNFMMHSRWGDLNIKSSWRYAIAAKHKVLAMKGAKRDPEIAKRVGAAQKGKIISSETRAKISVAVKETWALKGKNFFTPEGAARRAAFHKGKVVSAETRAKLSAAQKGRKRGPISAEHRKKMEPIWSATGRNRMGTQSISVMFNRQICKTVSHKARKLSELFEHWAPLSSVGFRRSSSANHRQSLKAAWVIRKEKWPNGIPDEKRKLTVAQISEIRNSEKSIPARTLADKYDVSAQTIQKYRPIPARRLSEDQIIEIRNSDLSISSRALGKKFGFSHPAITAARWPNGAPENLPRRKLSKDEIKEIRSSEMTIPLRTIAAKFGLCVRTVRKYRREQGELRI